MPTTQHQVVFIGDSIFEYWEKEDPEFFSANNYICKGIRGQTTEQILSRFEQDVIELKPAVVVIQGGINDISEYGSGPYDEASTLRNIIDMAETADFNGIKVLLLSVPYTSSFGWDVHVENPQERTLSLNKRIRAFAQQEQFRYVDCFAPMLTEKGVMARKYIPDDIHPNKKGYTLMQPLIQEAIAEILKTCM